MLRDRNYLDWLRDQRCWITWESSQDFYAVDPAHIGTAGKGIKSHDFEALPLRHSKHQEQHQKGEVTFWTQEFRLYPKCLMDTLKCVGVVYYLKYKLGISQVPNTNQELIDRVLEMCRD